MRKLKPTTVILAFAFMSVVSAKAVMTAADLMNAMPASAEAELLALRTTKPVIIEDTSLAEAISGEHLETRKLVLTSMTEEASAPKSPYSRERAHSSMHMSKPYLMADATPAPASSGAAPSIVNKSDKEQTFAVDSGSTEKVYTVAPGASVPLENCASGCTATGPWGYSRAIKAGEVLETTGVSEVTTTKEVKAVASAAPAKKKAASAPAKKKFAKAAKGKSHAAAKHKTEKFNPYFKGSFTSLFTGIVR